MGDRLQNSSATALAPEFAQHLKVEANRALRLGALCAAVLAATGVVGMLFGLARGVIPIGPWIFCIGAALLSLAIYALARRERVGGPLGYVLLLIVALSPALFFVLSHFTEPGGAATHLNGPLAYVNLVMIVVSAFLFDPRLTVLVSAEVGVGYFGCFLLARDGLATIHATDPTLTQEIVDWHFYAVKSVMIIGIGVTVAALTVVARRLVRRSVEQEQQRSAVDRLLGEYVSEEVKEKLLHEPAAQRGERKQVVVLFSDLRGFTTMSETMEPEQMVERLNGYFDAMVQAVTSCGGVVDKFIGDAVMAVFGGVLPLDDPCAAALGAAREMRARLALLNATWRQAGLEPFEHGIGLHAGEVLMGAIGSRRRKNFTVIGDAVNIAARVEGLTRGLSEPILLTGAVWQQLPAEQRRTCVPHGARKVKGRTAEVEIYGVPD